MPIAAPDAVKRLVETFDRLFDSLGCKLSGLTNDEIATAEGGDR